LEEIYEECRRKRTLPSIRPILAEKLFARGTSKSDDLRKFTHIINGQKWIGFIYNKRNSLMGSTFGFYKSKFTVIRGYPKIKYAEESRVIDKEVITEYKVDGCYDEETEVLSENGWKKFNNLQIGERLYTRNAEEKIELQACEKIISMNYDGILHHYQMRNLDSVVTPDHWNFVSLVHKPKHSKSWFEVPQRIQSKNMKNKRCIFYSDGTWEGKEEQVFRIGSMCLPMNLWLKFLGYWLTDGTKNCHKTSKEGYQVVIVQRKESWKQMFEVTKQLFPEATYYFNQSNRSHIISICNKNLWNYLNQFGMKHQRFIPKEIKFLQKSQLTILFDALLLGDGSKREKYIRFWTCSERMRDDFQELCLKVGFSASYSGRKKDSNINGRPIIAKRITYCLNVRLKHLRPLWIPQLNGKYKSRNFQEIEYHGNIYCAIVPNHVLYVRRNGKPIWSGNTNLGIWAFQDGSLMGKTRLVERWDTEGWHGRNWRDIFERTNLMTKITKLCKEDYQVFGELYGKENEGEFIKYCYDNETEILTENGFKLFENLNWQEKVLTLNPHTFSMEFQIPSEILSFDYRGKLIRFKNRLVDLRVTPNHNLFLEKRNGDRSFVKAEKKLTHAKFVRKGKWVGKNEEYFVLPEYSKSWSGNGNKRIFKSKEKKIKMDIWLKFMGYYLSEGYYRQKFVCVTQYKLHNRKIMIEDLAHLPFHIGIYKEGFKIHSRQLVEYVKQFGKSKNRFIPKELKALSEKQLRILYEALMLGDGSRQPKRDLYASSSERLLDDFLEISIKIGKSANKSKNLILIPSNGNSWTDSRYYAEESYDGKVWCVNVPNHVVFVRRNGKTCFCGNSVPIAFSILDIVDRRSFGFLGRDAKTKLCNQYELPLVEENWRGVLTEKEIERLEFQAKELLKEDGYEGFVAKSYIPEDKDVYFCYSSDTEILTPYGWRSEKDVQVGDEVFSFNMEKERIEKDEALFKISYPYSGKLLNLRSENVNLLISPNHTQIHKRRKPRLNFAYGDWETSFAKDLPCKMLIPCSYPQEDKEDFKISDNLIKIVAWIITEGHLEKSNNGIRISQYNKIHQSHVKEIRESLETLKWDFNYKREQEFRIKAEYGKIARKILGNYKHIPEEWIENFSNKQLKLLLETLMKGDGKIKDKIFCQKSLLIRDEVQQILTRLGYKNSNHSQKLEKNSYITFSEKHDEEVSKKEWISYNGIIWCLTTRNGFLITRRNGKVSISGNCKLKCQEVREKCWGMSSGFTIPSSIIMKAVQKATENLTNFNSKDEFEKFVREELLEEASEELVTKSKDKIRRIVERKMAIQVNDEEIIKFLDEMTSLPSSITGISIDILDDRNKRHIMKTLADKFIGFKPATLYQIYARYKKTKSKEKTLK
jgi:hypothetical protein